VFRVFLIQHQKAMSIKHEPIAAFEGIQLRQPRSELSLIGQPDRGCRADRRAAVAGNAAGARSVRGHGCRQNVADYAMLCAHRPWLLGFACFGFGAICTIFANQALADCCQHSRRDEIVVSSRL
jgi:hypothetical protein